MVELVNLQQVKSYTKKNSDQLLDVLNTSSAQLQSRDGQLISVESSRQVEDAFPDYSSITHNTVNRRRIGIPDQAIRTFFTSHNGIARTGGLDALSAKVDSLINSEDPVIRSLAQDYRLADDLSYIRSMRTNRLRLALQSDKSQLPDTWKGLIGNLKNNSFRNRQTSSDQAQASPNYKMDNGAIGDAFQQLNDKVSQLERTAKFWSENRKLLESDNPSPAAVKKALKQHVNAHRKAYQGEQIGIKLGLELAGCVMLPPTKGLAGMFPQRDYVVVDQGASQLQEFEMLTNHANKLVQKYRLLDTDDDQRINPKKLGCICVMFAKEESEDGKKVYVPFFGFSKGPDSGEVNIQQYLHRMGLPEIDLQVSPSNSQLLDGRYQKLKRHFKDLQCVGLKTPSKQAMISYMQFIDDNFQKEIAQLVKSVKLKNESQLKADYTNQETVRLMREEVKLDAHTLQRINKRAERFANRQLIRDKEEKLVSQGELDPMLLSLKSIESWNSLQCAEPAAIMAAAQLYYRMADMDLSLPFEGKARIDQQANLDESSETEYLAKETCGRCVVSGVAFGGLANTGHRDNVAMNEVDVTTKESLSEVLNSTLIQNMHGNKLAAGEHHSKQAYYDPGTKLPAMQSFLKALDNYGLGQMSTGETFRSNDSKPQTLPKGTEQSDLYNTFWSNQNFLTLFFEHFKGGKG